MKKSEKLCNTLRAYLECVRGDHDQWGRLDLLKIVQILKVSFIHPCLVILSVLKHHVNVRNYHSKDTVLLCEKNY